MLKRVIKPPTHYFGRRGHVVFDWIFFLTRCDEPTDAVHLPVGP